MAAVEKMHRDVQAKLSQQIEQLHKENASLQNEKEKLTRRMEDFCGQMQQG